MTTYTAALFVHSWLRWALLVVAVVLIIRTAVGWARPRVWTRPDERLQVALTGLMDAQLLLGFWLYWALSPIVRSFLTEPAAGMSNPALRFFGVEHIAIMLVAVIVAHAGRVVSRSAKIPALRHARACVATVVVLLLLLAAIPWPSLRYGRPLFRAAVTAASSSMLV